MHKEMMTCLNIKILQKAEQSITHSLDEGLLYGKILSVRTGILCMFQCLPGRLEKKNYGVCWCDEFLSDCWTSFGCAL